MAIRLVRDIYSLIYTFLDLPSRAMFALSCKSFLRFGIPSETKGIGLCHQSARYGYIAILEWIRQYNIHGNEETCKYASQNGQLEALRWLHQHNIPWNSEVCMEAPNIIISKYFDMHMRMNALGPKRSALKLQNVVTLKYSDMHMRMNAPGMTRSALRPPRMVT